MPQKPITGIKILPLLCTAVLFSTALTVDARSTAGKVHSVSTDSELARLLDTVPEGDTLLLLPGHYRGPLTINRSVHLEGRQGAMVSGRGDNHVIVVNAPGVTIENLMIKHSGEMLSEEHSGIYVTAAGDHAIIANNELEENLIGINLKGPESVRVTGNRITGRKDLRMNERGNGVQVWNSPGSIVENNHIRYGRDGIFSTTSRNNRFSNNHFSALRFAIHYMYTNHSEISSNISEGNHVGFALMYSSHLRVQGNLSRKDRDRGIFFNYTNHSNISKNRVEGGAEKCAFVYNSNINQIVENHFEGCLIGIHFTAGSERNEIWGNNFVANRIQVKYVGTRQLEWSKEGQGNYWSDHLAFDLDGDLIADKAYRPNTIVDQLVWRHPDAKILLNSPALQLLQWAQSQFPALHPGGVQDSRPAMQPNQL